MQKLGANQKLNSGMICVLESGICTGRILNPAVWNPESNTVLDYLTWGVK